MTTVGEPTDHRTAHAAAMPWARAHALAAGAAAPLPAVRVPLKRARGRVLAAPLVARLPHPAFDTAAMDGYAVAGPGPWTVVGRVLAGRAPADGRPLGPGQAVEIATGAPVPAGAAAVLPYELALREGGRVTGAIAAGRHVRRRGEEFAAGRELLPAGTAVTPAVLGLAATLGCDALTVHGTPQVVVLITGDEVVRAGQPPVGRVRDALGPLLPGLVDWAGGVTRPVTHLPDGRAPLAAALDRLTLPAARPDAGEEEAGPGSGTDVPVIVVCGASSRGPADHLRPVLRELRAGLLVDSVACRPGHPQVLARLAGGAFVVGLPGNPFAALGAAATLLVPLLGALAGRTPRVPERARLAGPVRTDPARTRLVPVTVAGGLATPVGHDHPALLWGAAAADALAVLPPTDGADPSAETLDVALLPLPR
jgi:molybdopterin molybdotransferase